MTFIATIVEMIEIYLNLKSVSINNDYKKWITCLIPREEVFTSIQDHNFSRRILRTKLSRRQPFIQPFEIWLWSRFLTNHIIVWSLNIYGIDINWLIFIWGRLPKVSMVLFEIVAKIKHFMPWKIMNNSKLIIPWIKQVLYNCHVQFYPRPPRNSLRGT